MARRMSGRVVVVTGATAGVGRATVRELARQGASIGLIARERERLEATRREVEQLGGRGLVLAADVADADAIEDAATLIESQLGPIDVWINNAMTSVFSPVRELTAEEVRRVTEVTYLGYVHGTLTALRRMLPRDRGVIVQVGSALAYRSIPLQAAYCGAKHATEGFTEALRCELLHDQSRVRVTSVHLPAVNTPQFGWVKSRLPRKAQPVPPIFQPEVAARAIVWAIDHERRELLVGWPTVKAIWADKLFPGLADRYLAANGYEGQQTPELADTSRPNNLWEPVAGEFGAHGAFDDRATSSSTQLWATTNRAWLGTGLAALVLGPIAFLLGKYR